MYPPQRTKNTTLGIEFRSDGAYVALVRPENSSVVGLGVAMYPAGTVVDGAVRQVGPAADAVDRILAQIRWARPPRAALAVPPAELSDPEATVSAPITDGGSLGTAVASARAIDLAVDAMSRTEAELQLVDTIPVAVVRFARAAEPALPMIFAQGAAGPRRWTACADSLAVDIDLEADHHGDSPDAPMVGPDPRDLGSTRWGRVEPVTKVRRAFADPGRFAPAIGAALGVSGVGPAVDLVGPQAVRSNGSIAERNWGVEAVR